VTLSDGTTSLAIKAGYFVVAGLVLVFVCMLILTVLSAAFLLCQRERTAKTLTFADPFLLKGSIEYWPLENIG
jgi:hypothetical protein